MLINGGIIRIDSGVEYLSAWRDQNGQCKFDQYLSNGRMLVNKVATGCGFTTYCLCNNENTILVAPRTAMLRNKMEQFNEKMCVIYYFNREKTANKTIDDLRNEFLVYCQICAAEHRPLKLLVTYDSFINLANMLEVDFGINIHNDYRIYIDESHSLIKDIPLKEFNNNLVLTNFLKRLFQYERLVFISATPIIKYIGNIDQFRAYDVDYWELEWSNLTPVSIRPNSCKNSLDAFDQIFKRYTQNSDPYGRHFFDAKYYMDGHVDYSYEAVIFVNSVLDIRKIITKYVNKLGLIDISDITVFCANTSDNQRDLHKVHGQLNISTSIPKPGQRHTTWTFATRTVFEGADFYSQSASSYVVANYNVKCLSLDIASDIPQIIGRQRLKENKFRDRLNVFYTNSIKTISDDYFRELQQKKMDESNKRISIWKTAPQDCKDAVLEDLNEKIYLHPDEFYLKTVDGFPQINNLIVISEQYSRDILKNQAGLFVMSHTAGQNHYSRPVQQLLDDITAISSAKSMHDKLKLVYDRLCSCPECEDEIFAMLNNECHSDVAYYFNKLPLERIQANGFDTWKMDGEISFRNGAADIKIILQNKFESGQVYSKKEIKAVLQDVYDSTGMRKTAKATDLQKYVKCRECKKDGLKAFKIL